MGTIYSANNYSKWEKTYVTSTYMAVVNLRAKIASDQFYNDVDIQTDAMAHDIPLLYVHGVTNVGNLQLVWDEPQNGIIRFLKKSFLKEAGNKEVTLSFHEATGFDLSEYRALFVAYRDCLTKLTVTIATEKIVTMKLRSTLIPSILY